jgi:outer membrane receptor protein involved in Fe transport
MINKYHLFSPRLSLSDKFNDKFRVRIAYGLSYKAPSMLQLYPGPVYFDIINLNHYTDNESRQLAVVTTYIYQPDNSFLKPSRGETIEGGFDFEHEEWNIRVTGFQKKITDGITSYSVLKTFEKEIWEVVEEYDDAQPLVEGTEEYVYVSTKMNTYGNALTSTTRGIEVSAQLPKLKATNTSFHLSGSYLKTNSHRDVPTLNTSVYLTGSQDSRYGVYETPSYNTYISRSNLTIIQHIPEIKLLVTLITEANWQYKYEVAEYPSIYPIAYYDETGNYISIPEDERNSDAYADLVNSDSYYQNTPKPTYFNFHLQVRKETKQGHSFSFYANNALWYNPTYIDDTNNTREYLNSKVSFGFGVNFKL